ncbi:MAG: response regulator [Desulfuromonas sp.]
MGKQLLLADDSVTIQKVVEITFADKDYEIVLTGNGDEALQAAQKRRPDLVLADVFMPGLDGYQLCERLKSDPNLASIPVLLLAGTFEPFDEERATQVGAVGWIPKPFTSQALIDKVEQTLAEAAEQAPQWQATPSKSPEESLLDAFEQVAATEFGSGRSDDVAPVDTEVTAAVATPLREEEPLFSVQDSSAAAETQEAADFATGGREDFSFEELASAKVTEEPLQASLMQEEPTSPAQDVPEMDEMPPLPPADFSFAPVEEEPALAPPAEEVFSDPFAADEQLTDAAFSADTTFETAEFPSVTQVDAADAEPELPSLSEFAAPVPPVDVAPPVDIAPQTDSTPVGAEVIDLREDQIVAEGKYAATKARVEARAAYLSDAELERIVERVAGAVIERLANPILEKVVWEVVPDLAEGMIREEMEKIKQYADLGT